MARILPLLAAFAVWTASATLAAAQELVIPRVAGTLHAVDDGPVEGVRVLASCGTQADSVVVDSTGHFSIPLACGVGQPALEIWDPSGRYHPSRPALRPRPGKPEFDLLLVPRRWTIASGTYADRTVEIDLAGATRPSCTGCSAFYGREMGDTVRMIHSPGIPAWQEYRLPLRLAFDHEEGPQVSERDSVAFMRVAESLEEDLGRRWFRPAQMEDIFDAPDADPFGSLIVIIDPGLRSAGRGNWAAQGGEILAAVIYLQSTGQISDPENAGVVAHELMHTLGFGHTCSWRSVMANQSCDGLRADSPTAQDVAHAQLLIHLRTLESHYGIYGSIESVMK